MRGTWTHTTAGPAQRQARGSFAESLQFRTTLPFWQLGGSFAVCVSRSCPLSRLTKLGNELQTVVPCCCPHASRGRGRPREASHPVQEGAKLAEWKRHERFVMPGCVAQLTLETTTRTAE
jgi:hypothetical protein